MKKNSTAKEVEVEVLPPFSSTPPDVLALSSQFLTSTDPTWINPRSLQPHPRNTGIYGEDEDVSDLVELIERSQWVKPLIVTPDGIIISGHRRWKATLSLELKAIPVEVKAFRDEIAQLEALLLENASRLKSTEQKVREAKAWEEIEREKALSRQRMAAFATNQKLGRADGKTLQANLPEAKKGQTRDRVAFRVGMKARTYEKAAQVVNLIDSELDIGNQESAQGLRKILNEQSVDAAYQLLKYEDDQRCAILEKIVTGKAKNLSQAAKLVRTPTPTGAARTGTETSHLIETEELETENCPPPSQKIEINTNEILIAFTSNLDYMSPA
ncbi:MAG: ParB/RepB/Spo0J family partition protein, partial [Microcystaceae cyanobacterium]